MFVEGLSVRSDFNKYVTRSFATWESGYFLFDTSVSTTRSRLAFIVVVILFGLYPTSSLNIQKYPTLTS